MTDVRMFCHEESLGHLCECLQHCQWTEVECLVYQMENTDKLYTMITKPLTEWEVSFTKLDLNKQSEK